MGNMGNMGSIHNCRGRAFRPDACESINFDTNLGRSSHERPFQRRHLRQRSTAAAPSSAWTRRVLSWRITSIPDTLVKRTTALHRQDPRVLAKITNFNRAVATMLPCGLLIRCIRHASVSECPPLLTRSRGNLYPVVKRTDNLSSIMLLKPSLGHQRLRDSEMDAAHGPHYGIDLYSGITVHPENCPRFPGMLLQQPCMRVVP